MMLHRLILTSIIAIGCTAATHATVTDSLPVKPNDTVPITAGFDGKCRVVDNKNDKKFYTDFAANTLKTSTTEPMSWRVVSTHSNMPKLIEAKSKPAISFMANHQKINFAENSYNMQCVIASH